jgi:hypothetical protein
LRSKAIVIVIALSTAFALLAATPSKKPKPTGAKKTAKKATAPKASQAKGSTASRKSAGKKASTKPASKKTQAASRNRRSTQREPTPERYQEIQQALADKGYFSGPVNGAWGADSVQALKRFQRDQNIGDDGKLGSLSLMALGLGPKRGTSSAEDSAAGLPVR